jgi:cell division transport system permease protein
MSDKDFTAAPEPLLPIDRAAERPLWVVLIVMAFLAALSLLAANMGGRSYENWQAELSGAATVQLTNAAPDTRLSQAEEAAKIIKAARPQLSVSRVSDSEALSLITPWLGEGFETGLPDGVTLPVLIRLSKTTAQDRDAIRDALSRGGIEAVLDDHSEWTQDITKAARAFRIGSWLILLVTFFAGTAATIFATHSAMTAQKQILSVFSQVGASDKFIAKLFIKRALKISLLAAAIGVLAAFGFMALYRLLRGPANIGLLPPLTPHLSDVILVIVMIFIFTGICVIAAGVSAKQILHKQRLYT